MVMVTTIGNLIFILHMTCFVKQFHVVRLPTGNLIYGNMAPFQLSHYGPCTEKRVDCLSLVFLHARNMSKTSFGRKYSNPFSTKRRYLIWSCLLCLQKLFGLRSLLFKLCRLEFSPNSSNFTLCPRDKPSNLFIMYSKQNSVWLPPAE